MSTLLIVTTAEDKSLPLFFSKKITEKYTIKVLLFHELLKDFQSFIEQNQSIDSVYVRDPFNSGEIADLDLKLKILLEQLSHARYIDQLSEIKDIYLEDKWKQYELFGDLMPKTEIMTTEQKNNGKSIFIKKRISSRGKGIILSLESFSGNPTEYIVQPSLEIKQEYRVNVINGQIIQTVVSKQFVVEDKAKNIVKVVIGQPETISEKLSLFTQNLMKKTNFDFVGYDIAELTDTSYVLIEANRSPQFLVFFKKTGINLAETLLLQDSEEIKS